MPRALKRGILGTSTMILSKDIDKYSFMCGLNFYETDVRNRKKNIWIPIFGNYLKNSMTGLRGIFFTGLCFS